MKKIILTGKQARSALREGVNLASDCVKLTIGPDGRNAILGRRSTSPFITNDGVTIAGYVFADKEEVQLGVDMVKEVSRLTEKEAGDGTSTATVLLQALVNKCLDKIDDEDIIVNKVNPIKLRNEINSACATIVDELRKSATPISSREDIYKVAKVSVEDESLANLITDIFMVIGKDGVIIVEEGSYRTEHEIVRGLEIGSGLVSEHLETYDGVCELKEPYILVTTERIVDINQILPAVTLVAEKGIAEIVIFANGYDEKILKSMIKNKIAGSFTILPVQCTDISKKYQHEDIASLTGAKVFEKLEDIKIEDLGRCEMVSTTKDKTMIVGGKGDDGYVNLLKEEQVKMTSEFDKESIGRRISSLTGGIALIKVGAPSQTEKEYLKLKVDDAVLATKYAMQEGVVRGGGLALAFISESLPTNILTDVILAPYEQIQKNSGGLIIGEDVIDPVKVTISALMNACSVGGTIITTDIAIANKNEKSITEEEN